MCGIFGAVFAREDEHVDADAALAAIGHRGPDARAVHRGPGVVLGHDRLAILDLSAEANQPMHSRDGAVSVVFNGEIYNHHDLRAELVRLGHAFRTRSDTEVILEGYRAWGEGVVERLDGMFAFGLYDASKQRLLLARDRAGKKPLYYTRSGATVRFASEVKALAASGFPRRVDVSSLVTMLAFGYSPAPRTMFRGVEQLPPATLAVAERDGAWRERRYWRAPFGMPVHEMAEEDACRELVRLVDGAVARRLEADVPLGAYLSGGIDSTILVGVMARHSSSVRTFSIGFSGDSSFDETAYARTASRAFGTEHTEFVVDPSSFDLVERLVAMHDGPFGDSSAIPTSIVAMLTRKHVKVALTGDGGDELFCGYTRFLAAEAEARIPYTLRRVAGEVEQMLPPLRERRIARLRRFVRRAALPFPDQLAAWTSFFAFDLHRLLRREVTRVADLAEPEAFSRRVLTGTEKASTLTRILAHNFETYLPYDLLVKADRASMMHSLEVRSPFLDTALVEFAARLPDRYRRRGSTTKWLLRRAYRDLVPESIMKRSKMGFGVPLGAWLRGDLRPLLLDHMSEGAALYEYVNRTYVEQLLAEHFSGAADHGHRIWLLLSLQVWLRSVRNVSRSVDAQCAAC